MAVELPEGLPHAREPAGEVAPGRFPTRRHADRLDELAVREENRFLRGVLEAVGVIQIAGALRQIARVRDVEHLALGVLELLEGQRRLAAAGTADDDQGRRLAIDGVLRVVEGDRLVEQMNRRPFRMQVANRQCFADRLVGADVGDPALVDRRTAQEARLVVVVVGDHFEHQRADLVAVANQREQQPVRVAEPGTVKLAVAEIHQLLDLGGTEIVPGDGIGHLAVTGLDARGVKAGVLENLHCRFQPGL